VGRPAIGSTQTSKPATTRRLSLADADGADGPSWASMLMNGRVGSFPMPFNKKRFSVKDGAVNKKVSVSKQVLRDAGLDYGLAVVRPVRS
jgi:hypothetical protein